MQSKLARQVFGHLLCGFAPILVPRPGRREAVSGGQAPALQARPGRREAVSGGQAPALQAHPGRRERAGRPRILLIRPDHIGDVLFTTPALRLLRAHMAEAHIVFLVGPWSRRVIERNPHVDEIVTFGFPWYDRRPLPAFWRRYAALIGLARMLSRYEFDAALNLRSDFWWGALLTCLLRVGQRVGYDQQDCSPFLTQIVPLQGRSHSVERNLRLVEASLGLDGAASTVVEQCELDFVVTPQEQQFAAEYLQARGVDPGDPLVAIHPGVGGDMKLWTTSGFAAVAQGIQRKHGVKLLLTGSSSERGMVDEIAGKAGGNCLVAAGDTTLGQLAAIFQQCQLVIGVDSGPLHLATACGVPTVHLFGPSDHLIYGPCGDARLHRIVRAGLACSPCNNLSAPVDRVFGGDCMLAIRAEDVLVAVEQLLDEGQGVGLGLPSRSTFQRGGRQWTKCG
ncbi:MAG: glycosyltransferase family 9 protein [Chloroflexi bacterium]|nr:glycosyltransferase family 9 protein [Chloroflexota bacterium]